MFMIRIIKCLQIIHECSTHWVRHDFENQNKVLMMFLTVLSWFFIYLFNSSVPIIPFEIKNSYVLSLNLKGCQDCRLETKSSVLKTVLNSVSESWTLSWVLTTAWKWYKAKCCNFLLCLINKLSRLRGPKSLVVMMSLCCCIVQIIR